MSRAKGNYRPGSDIDLAIMNTGVPDTTLRRITSNMEDSSLPYRVDLIDYHTVTHHELKDHIDRIGQPFYEKS
ncbi:nucleotidyltransferase domain-containing protein [Planctomycetota bacterium]